MSAILSGVWAAYSVQFVSFGLTLLAALIFWVVQGRAKVRWGIQHGFAHKVPNREPQQNGGQTNTMVYTSAILFTNVGRLAAKGVEVTLNFEPDSLSLWPQRHYTKDSNPDNRLIVRFDNLAPKETLTLNLLTIGTAVPNVLSVRAENGVPKEIEIAPSRTFSKPTQVAFMIWLMLGAIAAFYILISLVAWFAQLGG
jgi:hypothetical protein